MKINRDSKIFNIITIILKLICIVFLILFINVLIIQRTSKNEKSFAGIRIFNVATGSMIPVYSPGDILFVKEINIDELQLGDDITYLGNTGSFDKRVVTHRIISIEDTRNGKIFTTKGVANDKEDPKITGDQIYGKVVYKSIFLSILTKLMNNLVAFYIIVFLPLGLLVFLQIKDRIEENKARKIEEKDNKE